jgi:diamine N-acetyltransferase
MLWENPAEGKHYLWRFMIDENFQGKGYGKKAMALIIEHVRQDPNAKEIRLSYHKAEGSPQPFYERLGFKDTGEVIDGEYEMKLTFKPEEH